VCLEVPTNPEVATCGHALCGECFVQHICRNEKCPICRKQIFRIAKKHTKAIEEESGKLHNSLYKDFEKLSIAYVEKQSNHASLLRKMKEIQRTIRQLEIDLTTKDIVKGQEHAADLRRVFALRQSLKLPVAAGDPRQFELWHQL
jgi:hypothetical protein